MLRYVWCLNSSILMYIDPVQSLIYICWSWDRTSLIFNKNSSYKNFCVWHKYTPVLTHIFLPDIFFRCDEYVTKCKVNQCLTQLKQVDFVLGSDYFRRTETWKLGNGSKQQNRIRELYVLQTGVWFAVFKDVDWVGELNSRSPIRIDRNTFETVVLYCQNAIIRIRHTRESSSRAQ